MSLPVSTRLGPYEILASLGAGGMGEVYRARDTRLDRDVAIKVLPERFAQDPMALNRFNREAKAVAALSHPNIVAIYDLGIDEGRTYVVMELLEGQTLAARIKTSFMDWHSAVPIGLGIAEGLAAAHAKGIIHRDIKPENIYLTKGGGIKILDFGLARREVNAAAPVPVTGGASLDTQPGVLMGTVSYMAPEQVRGQHADARSDIFAFGCVLFEMLTGSRPYLGETSADVIAAILHDPPPTLSESGRKRPADLDRLVARCMVKDPTQRYQTGQELAAALRQIAAASALVDSAHEGTQDTVVYGEAIKPAPKKETRPSLAVLPFVNMSSDKENEYFSDGLAEELINVLSKVKGLQVASRTSSFAFKGRSEDVRRIGEQLGVRNVLEGSVRKSGNRLRINAQLVSVADGYQLWSETFNRQLEDVFEIQDEIAQAIAKALQVILTEKDKEALEKTGPSNIQAYDFYLRGMQYFHEMRRKSLEHAVQMFEQSIAVDPCYARAYAGLADCYSLLVRYWNAPAGHIRLAEETSRKALMLDPKLAEAHAAHGVALTLSKRYDEAKVEFDAALTLNPNLFEAYFFYARACLAQGKLHEAARLFDQASKVRPEDFQTPVLAAAVFTGLGQHEQAKDAYRRGVIVAQKHLDVHTDDARAWYLGASSWTMLGEKEKALDWCRRALAIDSEEPMTLYNVACVYALQGLTDRALDCLEKAVANGYNHKEYIQHDADFKSLQGHPRFSKLLASMNGNNKSKDDSQFQI